MWQFAGAVLKTMAADALGSGAAYITGEMLEGMGLPPGTSMILTAIVSGGVTYAAGKYFFKDAAGKVISECTEEELERILKGEINNISPEISAVKGSVVDDLVEESTDAIDNVIKSGAYSVGDATYMDTNDDFLRFIQNRSDVDPDGYFDIIAHGTPNGIEITHNGQKVLVDHRTAARLIQNADGYNGQNIRLLSCNAGALDNGFAQNLAHKLNVEVCAPTKYLWVTEDGSYFVAGMTEFGTPGWNDSGMFKVFIP